MNPPDDGFLRPRRVLILLAAILALSAFCRLYGLGVQGFEADEFYTIPASLGRHYRFQSKFRQPDRPVGVGLYRELLTPGGEGGGLGDVTDVLRRNVHAPLYFYLMHFWVKWCGTSEFALRLPSAVFGVASVFVIFLLGRELFGPFVGLFAAALMGLIPEQVYQSTNARMYSLLVLLATSSTYVLALLLRRRPAPSMYLLYGLISAAGLYTHYAYVFCLAAQTLYVWVQFGKRPEIRFPWAVTQVCVAASFAPWLFVSWAQKQTSDEALSWVSGGLPLWETFRVLVNQVGLLTSVPEAPLGRLSQLAALILILFGVRALAAERSGLLLLLGLSVVVPVGGILLADALGGSRSVTVTRYWLVTSPALYLLMAAGARPVGRKLGETRLLWAATALLAVAGVFTAAGSLRKKPYDFREMVRYVEGQVGDAEREVVLTEGSAAIPLAMAYYGRRELQVWRINLQLGEPGQAEFGEAMRALAERRGVAWLLSNQTEGAAAVLRRAGFRGDEVKVRVGPQNIQRYFIP